MNKTKLYQFANETGYNKETLEKMWRLTDILRIFGDDSILSNSLALRGGTQINLVVYDNLPRLSEDIDVDFCLDVNRNEMMAKRKQLQANLEAQMLAAGYTSGPKSRHSYALDSLHFVYASAGGNQSKIKVEINYMIRQHVLELEKLPVHFPLLEKPLEVLSVAPLETLAFKISALLRRAAARDLFDVDYFVKSGLYSSDVEKEMLRKLIVFYQVIESDRPMTPDSITTLINMESLGQKEVENKILPMIKRELNFDFLKAKTNVEKFLQKLLVLTTDEREFINLFQEKVYRPELLFGVEVGERVKNHPMAAWKCR